MDEITRRVRQCLYKHLEFVEAGAEFDMNEELRKLGLDSMNAIALLLDVEKEFAINFPDDMLVPQTFATGEAIVAAVQKLSAGG